MATSKEWAIAYARQSEADFGRYQHLGDNAEVPACHRLQFLQMTCEKLVKAHMCDAGASTPEAVTKTHAVIQKYLWRVLQEQMEIVNFPTKTKRELLKYIRQLAGEIDVLAPSVDREGTRPDNCEYPWEDANATLHSPLDWSFVPYELLLLRSGPTFLKLLGAAIRRLLD